MRESAAHTCAILVPYTKISPKTLRTAFYRVPLVQPTWKFWDINNTNNNVEK